MLAIMVGVIAAIVSGCAGTPLIQLNLGPSGISARSSCGPRPQAPPQYTGYSGGGYNRGYSQPPPQSQPYPYGNNGGYGGYSQPSCGGNYYDGGNNMLYRNGWIDPRHGSGGSWFAGPPRSFWGNNGGGHRQPQQSQWPQQPQRQQQTQQQNQRVFIENRNINNNNNKIIYFK